MIRRIAIALVGLLMITAGPCWCAPVIKPVGLDLEVYRPPYSHDKRVAAWKKAYYAGDQDEAERIARAVLSDPDTMRSSPVFALVEGRFMLALALDTKGQRTGAEGEFRDGLAILARLVGAQTDPGRLTRTERVARDWAGYFEAHLVQNLFGQSRIREANGLASIIPANPLAPPPRESKTESAVTGPMGRVATNFDTGNADGVTLSAEQVAKREVISGKVYRAASAHDQPRLYLASKDLLGFDQALHGIGGAQTGYDLIGLAAAALNIQRFAEALALSDRAVAIFEERQDNSRLLAFALKTQSRAIESLGNPAAAEAPLRRALGLIGIGDDPGFQLSLAANLFAQRKLAEAESLYRQVAEHPRLDSQMRDQVRIFLGYLALEQGAVARGMGDYRSICPELAERAAQMMRGTRATFGPVETLSISESCAVRQAIGGWNWAEKGGGDSERDKPPALMDEAFIVAQRAQSDPSAAALARAGARALADRSGVAALVDAYEAAIRERDSAGDAPPEDWLTRSGSPASPEQAARRDWLGQHIADLSLKLAAASPRFWDLRAPRPISLAVLQAPSGPDAVLLNPDEALISFMIPPDQRWGLVFAVSKDGAAWARLPIERANLLQKVNALRSSIDPRAYGTQRAHGNVAIGQSGFDRQTAWELYRDLFGDPAIQA
ncbi:MAG: hypothetical protein RL367_2759, partial [Pseudomonadota bacterium]